jgi:transcriptional regulator with XRE-family HTH domain
MKKKNYSFNPIALEIARCNRSYTQKKLSQKTGLNTCILSKMENFKYNPSMGELKKISRALNYPISFFYQSFEELSLGFKGSCICFENENILLKHYYWRSCLK